MFIIVTIVIIIIGSSSSSSSSSSSIWYINIIWAATPAFAGVDEELSVTSRRTLLQYCVYIYIYIYITN